MKKAKGFTLIDLLVIAGVVAILPGLIWPSLSRARENARRAHCLSNLKQLILGIKTYTPDYNEWYPTSAEPYQAISVPNHYKDMNVMTNEQWQQATQRSLQILAAFPNDQDRIWIEPQNEQKTDITSQTQAFVTAVRNAGFTNNIVSDVRPFNS